MLIVLLLLLPGVRVEDQTPSKFLLNKNSLRAFEAVRFLKRNKPNKKGPILFPNDGPPPPPTPLIVTSRPLIESIQRSELNPNNSLTVQSLAQTQVNPMTPRPQYLDNDNSANFYDAINVPLHNLEVLPYSINKRNPVINDIYEDYDVKSSEPSVIPAIYRGLTNRKMKDLYNVETHTESAPAEREVRQNWQSFYEFQPKYAPRIKPEDIKDEGNKDYNNDENFAFSYTVKDDETGDDFSHSQQSSGSTTNGEYRVKLPDGRTQIVSYRADENGYKADVRYNEENEIKDKKPLDLKSLKEKLNGHFNDHYIEHRVEQYKKGHLPSLNLQRNGKDNIYFDYGDKYSGRKSNSDYFFYDPNDDIDKFYGKREHVDKFVKNIANDGNKKSEDDYYSSNNDDADISKDYKDYSTESDHLPHKSKYLTYIESNMKNEDYKPKVKQNYDTLKDIFTKTLFQGPQHSLVSSTVQPSYVSEQSNFVSSTAAPSFIPTRNNYLIPNYDSATTEKVVYIGTKRPTLFTNIKNILGASSGALDFSTPATPAVSVTPSSYLYSTIASLKNKLAASRSPILSQSYIDRINKYITL